MKHTSTIFEPRCPIASFFFSILSPKLCSSCALPWGTETLQPSRQHLSGQISPAYTRFSGSSPSPLQGHFQGGVSGVRLLLSLRSAWSRHVLSAATSSHPQPEEGPQLPTICSKPLLMGASTPIKDKVYEMRWKGRPWLSVRVVALGKGVGDSCPW
jgi:hypothetical protein